MQSNLQSPARRGPPNLPAYTLTVLHTLDAAPRMRRVVLALPEGADFAYTPGQAVVVLLPLPEGGTGRRDYTIRTATPTTLTLDILDHGDTPGPLWARNVRPGDTVDIRGPRGRVMLDPAADWNLLTGDETCIPAIAHMLETAPAGLKIHTLIEVADAADEIDLPSAADLTVQWLIRGGPCAPSDLMAQALSGFALPEGRGRACLIGETSNVRRQRHDLLARGLPREAIASEGYWRPGRIGGHDHVED